MKTLGLAFFSIVLALICTIGSTAQPYKRYHVHEIMQLSQDSLKVGSLLSAKIGDTVLVRGIATIGTVVDPTKDHRPIMWAGARWVNYMRDSNLTLSEYAGVSFLQPDTITATTYMDRVRAGDYIEVLCRVISFPENPDITTHRKGTTQLEVIVGEKTQAIEFLDADKSFGAPIPVQISDFYTGATSTGTPNNLTGSKYIGMKVQLSNVTVFSSSPLILTDEAGNQMYVRDQSGYFTARAHQLRTFTPWATGTKLTKIAGYITPSTVVGSVFSFLLAPALPEDVEIGSFPPIIASVRPTRATAIPKSSESVEIRSIVKKGDFDIEKVELRYYLDTDESKMLTATQTKVDDTTYSAIIPAHSENTAVHFKTFATDKAPIPVTISNPIINYYHYRVIDRAIKISDVREPFFANGGSAYSGLQVTITGEVTATATDIPNSPASAPRIYIQDAADGYSGLYLNTTQSNDPARTLQRGDNVTVTGTIAEINSNTALNSPQVTVLSSGNNSYAPVVVKTTDLAGKRAGDTSAEKWEGMLIRFDEVKVADTNADGTGNFGEFNVVDQSQFNSATESQSKCRVETDDGNTSYGSGSVPSKKVLPRGTRISSMTGVMFFSFGNFKIVPRNDADFQGVNAVEGEWKNVEVIESFPNPTSNAFTIKLSAPIRSITAYTSDGIAVPIPATFDEHFTSVTLNSETLAVGLYTILIESNGSTFVSKVVVIR